MHFEDRHYVIFDVSELSDIDFSEVLESSAEALRFSVDGTKSFVKYDGQMPSSLLSLSTKSIEYTHEQIMDILMTSEWNDSGEDL